MKKPLIYVTLALGATASSVRAGNRPSAPAGSDVLQGQELAGRVQALFVGKCAECHGPHGTRSKAKFDYVADLERVASNPELVVPLQPDQSRLWRMVRRNQMPPEGSGAGPLTAEQKGAVRAWIAAGAPPPAPGQVSPPPERCTPADEGEPAGRPYPSLLTHLVGWLGRFHVLVVHFPIALLVAAAVREGWSWWLGLRMPTPAVRFCVLLGAAGATVGAVLGWLEATFGGMRRHRPRHWIFTAGSGPRPPSWRSARPCFRKSTPAAAREVVLVASRCSSPPCWRVRPGTWVALWCMGPAISTGRVWRVSPAREGFPFLETLSGIERHRQPAELASR